MWFAYIHDFMKEEKLKIEFFAGEELILDPIIIDFAKEESIVSCIEKYRPILETYIQKMKIIMERDRIQDLLGGL